MTTTPPPPPPPGGPGQNPSFGRMPADGPQPRKNRKRTLLIAMLSVIGVAALAAVGYFVVLPATGLTAGGDSNDDAAAQEPASTSPKPTPAPSISASEEPEETRPSVTMASAVPSPKSSASASAAPTPEPGESEESFPLEGDLGLSQPITELDCTDQYVVFYASSFVPEMYESEIQSALDANPGAEYVRSFGSCTTLNQMSDHDTFIYSVYSGPYDSLSEACAVSASSSTPDSYVKVLSSGIDPDDAVQSC